MRKRNHVIPVRLNAKELRFLEEQVEKSGLSREEYIRSIVMGGEVRARPCEHHTELLRKISGLCNNANQLAHVANGCGMAGEESIREMLRMTKETWRLVKEELQPMAYTNIIPVSRLDNSITYIKQRIRPPRKGRCRLSGKKPSITP